MKQVSGTELLPQFSRYLADAVGLNFPPERWPELVNGLAAAAQELHHEDAQACMRALLDKPINRDQIGVLARYLTVGESYFFREPQAFHALQTQILPALINSRRPYNRQLRIWSAACSSGEEAYSIAILLQQLIPDYQQWNITILGTDINPDALEKAESGIYRNWSFRNLEPELKANYFLALGADRYQIKPQILKMVTFSYHNLAKDQFPSSSNNTHAMDIIFCRNLLMYFTPEQSAKSVDRLCRSLNEGGWLIVNPAETMPKLSQQLETVNFPGAILYCKKSIEQTKKHPDERIAQSDAISTAYDSVLSAHLPDCPATKHALPATPPPAKVSMLQQALTSYRQGRYQDTLASSAAMLEHDECKAPAMQLMAKSYASQGLLSPAIDWCERAIAADRLNPSGYYLLALLLLEQGQTEKAVQELRRTLFLDHHFVMAYFTLGNIYRHLGKGQEAAKQWDIALQCLSRFSSDAELPESDGMTAGQMTGMIKSVIGS